MTYTITHEIHPNNETRLTLFKKRGVFSSLKERAAQVLACHPAEVRELARSKTPGTPLLDIRSEFRTSDLSVLKNSHSRTSFGKAAVTRIFRAAGALDRFASSVGDYLFLTATLPGNTDEAKWAIAEYAHEIIDGLKSWLSKRLSDRKEFYVWENQGRGALHFHYCIYCPDIGVQENIKANFKAEMVRLYDGIGKRHYCDFWGRHSSLGFDAKVRVLQARVEIVYKSVGAYMAGYLGGKDSKHSGDSLHPYYPKRWFGVSRPLSALIDSYTEKESHEFTSLKEAYEYYNATKEEILDDALDVAEFPHKIGEGKTIAVYHTQENQQKLWQAKKMSQITHKNHPNINLYISLTLKNTQLLRGALVSSKRLQAMLPLKYVLFLQDVTWQTSLKSGALHLKHLEVLEGVFCAYDFSSSSEYKIRSLFPNLRAHTLLTARYHPHMRFNPAGWLSNSTDWKEPVDIRATYWYRGTTSSKDGKQQGEIATDSVMSGEPNPSLFEQKNLW